MGPQADVIPETVMRLNLSGGGMLSDAADGMNTVV